LRPERFKETLPEGGRNKLEEIILAVVKTPSCTVFLIYEQRCFTTANIIIAIFLSANILPMMASAAFLTLCPFGVP
jgi:hypothetical protein